MIGAILLQIVLIVLNAVFASAEIAVLSSNAARTEQAAEAGNKKAKKILALTENSSRFLSTIQVAITLAGLLGSAYAAENFSGPLVGVLLAWGVPLSAEALDSICVLLITVLLSFFSIVFGELVPKRVAMKNPDKSAFALAGLLYFVSKAFAPFVWVLTKVTNGVLRLMRIDPNEKDDGVTEEDIRILVQSGQEKGTLDREESELIRNIFEFDDTEVSEICTHRRDLTVLYQEDGEDAWREILKNTEYSFYPVCGDNVDHLLGVLNAKRFFRTGDMASSVESAYCVPEHMKADALFSEMKKRGKRFAVVVDEYGGMQGIVTLHDLIDLLVGDLHGEACSPVRAVSENVWQVDGSAAPEEVEKVLGVTLQSGENETLAGCVLDLLGIVPEDGSTPSVETEDLILHVTSVKNRRIESVEITRKVPVEERV